MRNLGRSYQSKPLKMKQKVEGLSARALAIHHDDLYEGYVKKANEIQSRLGALQTEIVEGNANGNSTYSELRGLKEGETYAVNGIYLHEWYFEGLRGVDGGSDGVKSSAPALSSAIEDQFNSVEDFIKMFSECAMAARGWTILAWDTKAHCLAIYNCDSHNHGGVWGAIPIIVLDVYEHAYFMDFGSDRADYIDTFWKSFDWKVANRIYSRAQLIHI